MMFFLSKMYDREYFSLVYGVAVRFSYIINGIMNIDCIKNLQACLTNLVALMFIIQPGMMALLVTVYRSMIHASGLPEIS
jgi:hypothetical protein